MINRDEPPDNDQSFALGFSGLLQRYTDWRLKTSLKNIKEYEDKLNAVNCNECANGFDRYCKFREVNQRNYDSMPAGVPCKFWRSKKDDGVGEPCDYRGG